MLKLADMANAGGRPVRQDDPEDLGLTTAALIVAAIDEGRYDDAKDLATYTLDEGRALRALFCDWVWDLLTRTAEEVGERAMIDVHNEMLPMQWGGHPLWVTAYDEDPAKPCEWRFYKHADDISEHYYTRVDLPKPKAGEGSY